MPHTKPFRFARGLLGISLAWGVAWAAFNAAILFVRWLPSPPEGISRERMAFLILTNQSKSALIWGCVYGALFASLLAVVSRRWPAPDQLRIARLTSLGAVVGLALPTVFLGFGSLLNVAAIGLSGVVGAGLGAALATLARRSSVAQVTSSQHTRLPSI